MTSHLASAEGFESLPENFAPAGLPPPPPALWMTSNLANAEGSPAGLPPPPPTLEHFETDDPLGFQHSGLSSNSVGLPFFGSITSAIALFFPFFGSSCER